MSLAIGLVGVGPWGAHILRDLRSIGTTVHAVARSAESITRAHEGGAASIVDEPGKLPDCAGYVIANRTVSHLDALDDLLPRGRPIFVEKPISPDLQRVKRLPADAFERVFIMHKWRYHPGVIELARIAAKGEYGPPQAMRTFRVGWGTAHSDVSSLWTLAPHDLSIVLEVLGEVPRLVAAHRDPMAFESAGAIAHLETRGGVPVTMEVSSGHPTNLRRIMLRCRDAVCELDGSDYGAVLITEAGQTQAEKVRISDAMPLLAELRVFVEHLKGGSAPVTPLHEEIKIIEVIAAIDAAIGA